MGLSTHVLDTSTGKPAKGVPITLERRLHASGNDTWAPIKSGTTDDDGRLQGLVRDEDFVVGTYRMTFNTAAYFALHGVEGFYPYASIVFEVRDSAQHYHVPLLLSPFGYSTYRGS
ncbi:MAG: hydroxyisourate hydrolase [Myxococcota bacterium]